MDDRSILIACKHVLALAQNQEPRALADILFPDQLTRLRVVAKIRHQVRILKAVGDQHQAVFLVSRCGPDRRTLPASGAIKPMAVFRSLVLPPAAPKRTKV